jgi:hypothetical protein
MPLDDNKAVLCRGANNKTSCHTMIMLHCNEKGKFKIDGPNVEIWSRGRHMGHNFSCILSGLAVHTSDFRFSF